MDTNALKRFAQAARNLLIDQVASKLDVVLADHVSQHFTALDLVLPKPLLEKLALPLL